jgi:hypothetical protein
MRYLHWDRSYLFYTASAGKYYSDLWFSLRTWLFPGDDGLASPPGILTDENISGRQTIMPASLQVSGFHLMKLSWKSQTGCISGHTAPGLNSAGE